MLYIIQKKFYMTQKNPDLLKTGINKKSNDFVITYTKFPLLLFDLRYYNNLQHLYQFS